MTTAFIKMNGAGNDFVIFDGRTEKITLTPEQVRDIAARGNRVTKGGDQVIVMEPSKKADVFMRIYNADGSESSSCGNATRCIASLMPKEQVIVETRAGLLDCRVAGENLISVDMGAPKLKWEQIPLSEACDLNRLPITVDGLPAPSAVGMGNPHMVFVVPDVEKAPVLTQGPKLEHHPLYPERANVGFAQVVSKEEIKLRVWERGAGETLACGTGACAALVALHKRGLVGRKADVHLPGGVLTIVWDEKTGHIWMTGPVAREFEGKI